MILTREHRAISDRIDRRFDMAAGLKYNVFPAPANLHMSARIDRLDEFRAARQGGAGGRLTITHLVARAAALALGDDPLFAALFDGRDRLEISPAPSLGVSVDCGDDARFVVVPDARSRDLDALARAIRDGAASVRASAPVGAFSRESIEPVPAGVQRARLGRFIVRELRDRYDYLVPGLQDRRFKDHVARAGHFAVHSIGMLDVQTFKGWVRRPSVASLWVLSAFTKVVAAGAGWGGERRLPMVLVFSEEIITIDRACGFLGGIIAALENPPVLEEP